MSEIDWEKMAQNGGEVAVEDAIKSVVSETSAVIGRLFVKLEEMGIDALPACVIPLAVAAYLQGVADWAIKNSGVLDSEDGERACQSISYVMRFAGEAHTKALHGSDPKH